MRQTVVVTCEIKHRNNFKIILFHM